MTRKSIWHRPAAFWLGVGGIAEVPFTLAWLFIPRDICQATLGQLFSCPLPLSLVITFAVVIYILSAWIAHHAMKE